jgi:phosphatidylserine/phosphatidylglycerophosphate/cardiolipin synthase-like enzyme
VAVARTMHAYGDEQAVREVERLYLDSIAAARRTIYIENQYLSSHRIGEALKQRLEEAEGPEVVIVLPQKTGGWLEQHTMDVLRGRILRNLRASDQTRPPAHLLPEDRPGPRLHLDGARQGDGDRRRFRKGGIFQFEQPLHGLGFGV